MNFQGEGKMMHPNLHPPRLFINLTPNFHTIAHKSKRFNVDDKEFIKDEIRSRCDNA